MNKIIKNYTEFNKVNEGIINDIKNLNPFRNKKLITKINNVLENDNLDEMYNLLEEILPLTHHQNTEKIINKLKDSSDDYKNIHQVLTQIKHYLKNNDISDIRVYGPNHGSSGFVVNDQDMSFSG